MKIPPKYLEEIKKCVHLHPRRQNFLGEAKKFFHKNAAGICGIKNSDLSLQSVRRKFAGVFSEDF